MNSTEGKVYQYGKYHEIIKFEKRTNSCNELNNSYKSINTHATLSFISIINQFGFYVFTIHSGNRWVEFMPTFN